MIKPLKYLFTLAVPLAIVGMLAMKTLGPPGASRAGITYDTALVSKGPIRKLVSTSGPVRALVTVSIGSQLSGQVDKLSVDFNSEVKSGDVLATIDSRTFDAKVSQAKADLTGAVCPFAGHIRKTYPRDDTSDSIPDLEENTTQTHRLLRRGITGKLRLDRIAG